MIEVDPERFEALVDEALAGIPSALVAAIDNVAVFVEEEDAEDRHLLGLYEGIPLTERDDYGGFAMPDRITIFRRPILRECRSEAEVVEQVRITVVHEVAHHFGIDDDRLDELGYG